MKSISERRQNGSGEIKGFMDRRERETETKRIKGEQDKRLKKRTFMTRKRTPINQ
jgi:hypothetical protein